ncbi:MAG: glycosidase [Rhodothermales bacterium]|jgi:glycosidase
MPATFLSRFSTLVLTLLLAAPAMAQAPSVDKVEPPNWWVGMQWDELQLMIYGENLGGLTASFEDPALTVTGVHTLESTSYGFVDFRVPADLEPGTYALNLRTAGGSVRVDYEIRTRAPLAGRNQGFSKDDVVYLITPDRFANGDRSNDSVDGLREEYDPTKPGMRHGGDLQGIIDHLDYLEDLGVTTLWLNPVLENNGRSSYHGYAATDLYKIDARFGSNADYRRFVDEAHARGLKVIFDHVNNHIGINHSWMSDLPAASWINGTAQTPGAHYKLAPTDPYADPHSAELLRGFWFVPGMPDLNQRDPFVATYRIQNTLWWLEFSGLDGIREDTYPYPDQAFMARWAKVLLEEFPDLNIVGEIWEDAPGYLAMFQAESKIKRDFETNLPSVMDFALMEAMRKYVRGEGTLKQIYTVFAQDFLYSDPDNILTFFDNHDVSRAIFEAKGHPLRVRQMLAVLLTSRGIPQLLYGTELGMMGGASHVELRADMPGGFPGDERSVFGAAGRTEEENAMFNFTRGLLHARRDNPALRQGALVHYPTDWRGDTYKYLRITDDQTILVLVNGLEMQRTIELSELAWRWPEEIRVRDLLTGREQTIRVADGYPIEDSGVRVLEVLPVR